MADPAETLPPPQGPVTVETLFWRSMKDAADQRRDMTGAITTMAASVDRLAVAMSTHNTDAAARSKELLTALQTRDASAVVAVQQLAGEQGAQRAWLRETAERAAKEVWPLLRVPAGLALAYWGARYSGALPLVSGASAGNPSVAITETAPAGVSASPPPASPPAPASAPESHGDPSSAVGEPWHEDEGPTR